MRKQCSFLSTRPNLYHWRFYSGAEVDFILEYNGVYYPIEAKAKSNPSRRDTMGISAFRSSSIAMLSSSSSDKAIVLAYPKSIKAEMYPVQID